MDGFVCQLCGYMTISDDGLDEHILNRHRNTVNAVFVCDYPSCGQTFLKYDSLKKHKKRSHDASSLLSAFSSSSEEQIADHSNGDSAVLSRNDIKCIAAHFLLKIRANHRISNVGATDLASNLAQFMADYSGFIKREIIDELRLNIPNIEGLINRSSQLQHLFTPKNFFSDLRSVHLQNQFLRQKFVLVEPIAVKLGEKLVRRKTANKNILGLTTVNCYGYYVPLIDSLSSLLRMPEVANEVLNRYSSDDGLMRDLCDGEYCINHPILADPKALKIISYHDEFNVANPLGPHVKPHKVLAFYYSLGNIRPEFRSKLSVPVEIQNLASF